MATPPVDVHPAGLCTVRRVIGVGGDPHEAHGLRGVLSDPGKARPTRVAVALAHIRLFLADLHLGRTDLGNVGDALLLDHRGARGWGAPAIDVHLLTPANHGHLGALLEERTLSSGRQERSLHVEYRLRQEQQTDVVVGVDPHAQGEEIPLGVHHGVGHHHPIVGPGQAGAGAVVGGQIGVATPDVGGVDQVAVPIGEGIRVDAVCGNQNHVGRNQRRAADEGLDIGREATRGDGRVDEQATGLRIVVARRRLTVDDAGTILVAGHAQGTIRAVIAISGRVCSRVEVRGRRRHGQGHAPKQTHSEDAYTS